MRFLILLIFLLASSGWAAETDLSQYSGNNRLLLIFPGADLEAKQKQAMFLIQDPEGIAERDLMILDLHSTDDRSRHGVKVGEFTVVLIGKDGQEKLRKTSPIGLDELFKVIDAMPMRKDEVRKKK